MLRVKTILKKSPIHNIGTFAAESISKGAIVFEHDDNLDIVLDRQTLEQIVSNLPKFTIEYLLTYICVNKKTGKFHLAIDNAKYINHSKNPNIAPSNQELTQLVAIKDIKKGEELTFDYNELDLDHEKTIAKELGVEVNFDYCK